MRPRLPQLMTFTTPGPSTVDPVSGNLVPGPPTVETGRVRISQAAVANVGSQFELMAGQHTVISMWTVLIEVPGPVVTSETVGVDDRGRKFAMTGDVADRPNHKPVFRAAAARLISDMQ